MSHECQRAEQLVRYFEQALDEAEMRAFELHLPACAACQADLERLRELDALLGAPEAPSKDFMQQLFALPDSAPARPAGTRVLSYAAAAAAVLLVAVLVRGRFDSPAEPPWPRAKDEVAVATLPTPPDPAALAARLAKASIPVLHRLARGADLERAHQAIAQLGLLRRRESLPVLLDAVRMQDRSAPAIEALGRLADARAVPILEPLLQDPVVAVAAREAIVKVGGREAALALGRAIDVIDATETPEYLAPLIDALARADGGIGVRRLGRLLKTQDETRVAAARTAIRKYEARLLPFALKEVTSAPTAEIEHVLEVLDVLTPPAAVPALTRLFKRRAHRERAAHSLVLIDTAEAAEALWQALPAPAARRAFRRGGRGTERWLLERLGEPAHRTKRLAIDLLGLCGGPQAVPSLAALADDQALAPGVLLSLGRIGGEEAVRALAALSRRPALRRRAMDALGRTGSPAAVAELERLGLETRTLRAAAQQALSTIPCAEAVAAIVRLDGGARARRSTERALRGMDRALVLATLDTLLDEDMAATVRRVRSAVGGGPVLGHAPRVALN